MLWDMAADDTNRALFNPGNEPSFMTPFLYNYVQGKQYKTVEKTRYLVNKCACFV